MTKSEYLSIVHNKLNKLPKEDYDKAMDYLNSCFDKERPEDEQKVINELGDPSAMSDKIIRKLAIENEAIDEKDDSIKGSLNEMRVGILAVLATPIALPISIALIAVVFSLVIAIVAVAFSLGLFGAILVCASPILIIAAGLIITKSVPVFLVCFGIGLICLGFGALIVYLMWLLFKWAINACIMICGKIARKGEKKR